MRSLFLCFLLCLIPLRLWAGSWMPITASSSHHLPVLATVSPAHHNEAHAAHDCHEALVEPLHEAHAQLALLDASVQQGDCHDGNCQLCGVCHQGLSLTQWPLVMPVFQAHPLPVGASLAHVVRSSPPLIKPPIS
ncbi:hypothetical protein B9Z45_13990 [Limnohabitans sp. 2KL-17]|uniref:hypothetical protein n=1 Tax=Limnohabitans sp. 2KL-17 TaxID=1100704 RepID=UPI000D3CB913|nr:hypothetical protein [Limnohabitans sp. 2KL-17]PUE52245.1 hypothetical protein B9Z45_13990 [Limnohabitans sp. 2KL-17]